jgi:hypothetical protein
MLSERNSATNTKTISNATANGNLRFIYGCIVEQVSEHLYCGGPRFESSRNTGCLE